MKRFLVIFLLLLTVATTPAEQIAAEEVVRILITAAHKDELLNFLSKTDLSRIAADPRHGLSPEALVALLKTIPLEDLTFEINHTPTGTIVRTTGKVRLDFRLEERPVQNSREGKAVVVAVTP